MPREYYNDFPEFYTIKELIIDGAMRGKDKRQFIFINKDGEEEEKKSAGESKSWLIFNCLSDSYAIESSCVREILRNNVVFPVPFVPSYVKGVLNFYGKPFAVIDFASMPLLSEFMIGA